MTGRRAGNADHDNEHVHGASTTTPAGHASRASIATSRLASLAQHILPLGSKVSGKHEFDYVIVGGGTAGSVLANRLTEDYNVSVAVIEGGPSDVGLDRVLNLSRWLELLGSELDYDYTTTAQPRGNSDIRHSRAKVLGGCSSHNTLISFRPLKEDLDWWAQCHGCPSWSADKLQPYGDRLKLNTVPVQAQHRNQVVRDWVNAAAETFDAPLISDFNAQIVHRDGFTPSKGKGAGFFSISYDPYNGDRSSASTSYLHPIMPQAPRGARKNLHLFLETWAEKVVFDGANSKRIRSVQVVQKGGQRFEISARRDVILCAGAIDTPRLLLLSGIGSAADLASVGIECKHDLPGVGRNLSDHPETIIMWETRETPKETVMLSDAGVFLRVLPPSEEPGNGELHKDQPDMMMHCYQVVFGEHLKSKGYKLPEHAFCMTPNIPRSQARGTIKLASANPADKPLIDFKYFEDERRYDERILVEGLKAARKIAQHAPFRQHLVREVAPGPAVQTDEELSAYARSVHHTVYHPSSSCKMGTPGQIRREGTVSALQGKVDDEVVCDEKNLKVVGLQGLRICDASVMPVLPTINPMLTILMVAERAADLIKWDV
ncbi:GMC oxidoreductase [Tilletiaria anomala UBC 951]|uniref:GMC oxidoreductase n=1 Tax=Tilletiaria anomala (strain ATCC 24038 / CBS 436.72 / UBC 951) TaxID=1037660 RepID=A0A066WBL0_TILAU|nr:GMC oxidoreductase [Tilletiaria anomala UBC 951]KDN51322.1 GMC oxidoreductase [Tilletiaria anomala UBC 951]